VRGIVFLSVGVGALFAFRTHLNTGKEVGERVSSTLDKGKGQGLGAIGNKYANGHTPPIRLLNTNSEGSRRTIAMNDPNGQMRRHRDSSVEYQRGHVLRSTLPAALGDCVPQPVSFAGS
jgi:hypothetical protein